MINKNYLLGIGFKLLNCLLFPVMSIVMLECTKTMPLPMVLIAQTFFGAIISLIYLIITKKSISLNMEKKDFLLYVGRALSNMIAMAMWMFSLSKLGVNEATALGYTGPLWVFLMARYIIGEKFRTYILALIAINMIGMYIILEPKFSDLPLEGIAGALGSILLWAIYEVICKKQTANQHYMLQSFYFMTLSTIMLIPFAVTSLQIIDFSQVALLFSVAVIAVANITVIFLAYSLAPLMLLAPFSYTRLVFTVILTAVIYGTMPNIQTFIGAAIIMTANLYMTYYFRKKEI
ncbi:MAG: DMT family transporter [Rickettsiales bacterium]